jgi:hypothetical protein
MAALPLVMADDGVLFLCHGGPGRGRTVLPVHASKELAAVPYNLDFPLLGFS